MNQDPSRLGVLDRTRMAFRAVGMSILLGAGVTAVQVEGGAAVQAMLQQDVPDGVSEAEAGTGLSGLNIYDGGCEPPALPKLVINSSRSDTINITLEDLTSGGSYNLQQAPGIVNYTFPRGSVIRTTSPQLPGAVDTQTVCAGEVSTTSSSSSTTLATTTTTKVSPTTSTSTPVVTVTTLRNEQDGSTTTTMATTNTTLSSNAWNQAPVNNQVPEGVSVVGSDSELAVKQEQLSGGAKFTDAVSAPATVLDSGSAELNPSQEIADTGSNAKDLISKAVAVSALGGFLVVLGIRRRQQHQDAA